MKLELNIPSVDVEISKKGVWCDFSKSISFLIAREGIPEYARAIKESYEQHKHELDTKSMSDEESDLELCKIIVKYILLDWKGLTSKKNDFPYSEENAIALLMDDAYFELRQWITMQSRNLENYRGEKVKK